MTKFMTGLDVYHLWFDCTAQTEVAFGPQAGAQVRGALWETMAQSIGDTELLHRLMSLENPKSARGANPARPFAVRPPLGAHPGSNRAFVPGESFSFGVSLFGTLLEAFPYVVQAVYQIGQIGIGYGRGRYTLSSVRAYNPLTGEEQSLLDNSKVTGLPSVYVSAPHVAAYAHALPSNSVRLKFLTPTQITGSNKKLESVPPFDRLIARLIERCQSIEQNYGTVSTPTENWKNLYLDLTEHAVNIEISRSHTQWVNVRSGSRRANSGKKISGFIGDMRYVGNLRPFLPWLVWGQVLQIGKNTVKGDGWYSIG